MKVALTGGIACGKSLLSLFLNELGVETLDADDIVHELLPDPVDRRRIAAEVFADPAKRKALEAKLHPLVKRRIDEWLADEGDERRETRDESDERRETRDGSDAGDERRETRDEAQFPKSHVSCLTSSSPRLPSPVSRPTSYPSSPVSRLTSPLRIAVIPLLFEVHWEENFDIICCVASSRESQIARMTATRGMTRAEAEARLAAQLPVEEKARRSHYVIRNDGTADELRTEARKLVDWLNEQRAAACYCS